MKNCDKLSRGGESYTTTSVIILINWISASFDLSARRLRHLLLRRENAAAIISSSAFFQARHSSNSFSFSIFLLTGIQNWKQISDDLSPQPKFSFFSWCEPLNKVRQHAVVLPSFFSQILQGNKKLKFSHNNTTRLHWIFLQRRRQQLLTWYASTVENNSELNRKQDTKID